MNYGAEYSLNQGESWEQASTEMISSVESDTNDIFIQALTIYANETSSIGVYL